MKNLGEIRDILCEQVEKLRNGKVEPKISNAIVNVTSKILTTVKMEMEYAKMTGQQPNSKFISKSKKQIEPPKPKKKPKKVKK